MTRTDAIMLLIASYPDVCYSELREAFDLAIDALHDPEIIRCKDCKFFDEVECRHGLGLKNVTKISYCIYARRKEKTDD